MRSLIALTKCGASKRSFVARGFAEQPPFCIQSQDARIHHPREKQTYEGDVLTTRIPFSRPVLVGEELRFVADSVARAKLSGNGHYTVACQEEIRAVAGGGAPRQRVGAVSGSAAATPPRRATSSTVGASAVAR